MKQYTNVIPNEKTVLRDQIIEDSRGAAIWCKLLKIVRDKPDSSLLDVRNKAFL